MMLVSAYGRLGQDPRRIETKTGKAMCVTSMAVDLYDKDGESHTQWLNVVGFGKIADLLGKQKKGDLASISGRCQINRWTKGDGQEQEQLSIIVDSIISSRAVRPGGKSGQGKSPEQTVNGLPDKPHDTPFDDELPF